MNDSEITTFALFMRAFYLVSPRGAQKIMYAVRMFVENGECDSNGDDDSVCGGVCDVCKKRKGS